MGANERGMLPSDLVRGRARFQAWRERRVVGERIPQSLWALAVRLTETHGVSRTATGLGLDYYSLKELATAAASEPHRRRIPGFRDYPDTTRLPSGSDRNTLYSW
jgi:hypothetical protein